MVIFAVKVIERDNKFLVVLPPSYVGPCTYTKRGIPGERYPKYYAAMDAIVFSCWRLPFILTDKSVPDKENLELLLSMQLNFDISVCGRFQKLNLRREHSSFYLKEFSRYVDVVIYEGHVESQSTGWKKHCPTDWIMPAMSKGLAREHLSPPFSVILDLAD